MFIQKNNSWLLYSIALVISSSEQHKASTQLASASQQLTMQPELHVISKGMNEQVCEGRGDARFRRMVTHRAGTGGGDAAGAGGVSGAQELRHSILEGNGGGTAHSTELWPV